MQLLDLHHLPAPFFIVISTLPATVLQAVQSPPALDDVQE